MPKGLLAASAVLFVLLTVACQAFYQLQKASQMPPALERAQVLAGADRYEKRAFFSGAGLGDISDISVGWPADRESAALVLVGNQGAHFLTAGGSSKKYAGFSRAGFCPMQVVRLDQEGNFGFLTRDQSWASDVVLYDRDGRKLWNYSGFWGVDDSAAGFLNGADGPVFVVGLNGAGGVRLLNRDGQEIWRQAGANIWHVEIMDASGNSAGKILHTNARGELLARNDRGQVTAQYAVGGYVSAFALVRWGMEAHPTHLLFAPRPVTTHPGNPQFRVLDGNGEPVADFDAPLSDLLRTVSGSSISFKKGAATFAALQGDRAKQRALLYLFDERGQMVYQEILAEACRGIAALPGETGETLLVGCNNKVWEYRSTGSASRSRPAPK